MNYNTESWYTHDDITNDLARNGYCLNNIGGGIIVGNQPPPRIANGVDDEISLHFGKDYQKFNADFCAPDLKGITSMIRMVQENDAATEPEKFLNIIPDSGVVISKLNPNVKEFVPRTVKKEIPKIQRVCKNLDTCTQVNLGKETKAKCAIIKQDTNKIDGDEGSTLSTKNPAKEIEDTRGIITNKLRNKFINAANDSKQRNVAIAALLKLHSSPNISPSPSIRNLSKPKPDIPEAYPKLMTPDYFQKSLTSEVPQTVSETKIIVTETKQETINKIEKKAENIDSQIKESIMKVNEWLNKPGSKQAKPNGPAVMLGPITFKRKDRSPTNMADTEPKTQKMSGKSFEPTEYADNLAKSYMERQKLNDNIQGDIWTNLEKELLVKDQQIKSKLAQAKDVSANSK